MITTSPNIGLIFSGGGARGSFQIGMWQAMKELGLDKRITHVYGTSVGAINGAAFAQGDFELANEIWSRLNYSMIFNDPKLSRSKKYSREYYYALAKAMMKDRGLNVEPLKNLLRDTISEDKIRRSPVEFGLVVFDLSKKMPLYLKKSEIPKGKLVEFIIASATFPLFQPHRIEGGLYIDGGVYDNRPLDFVSQEKSIEKVLCVDVTIARHFWPNKKINREVDITFLRPSKLLGSPLAFRKDKIQRNVELGYLDGMKQLKSH